MRQKIEISRDDYEALHLTALAFGNKIGQRHYDRDGDKDEGDSAPHCIMGHAYASENSTCFGDEGFSQRLNRAELSIALNDEIVPAGKTLTFAQFMRKANVVPKD